MKLAGAFSKLRYLLSGLAPPPELVAIDLYMGEVRLQVAATHFKALSDIAGWTRYPPMGGTSELRASYSHWLERRFGVRHSLTSRRIAVEPIPGIKQALVSAMALAVKRKRERASGRPTIVLPNPFYPTYHLGAQAIGAREVFYTYDGSDYASAVAKATHATDHRVAAIIVCNPGTPRGEILSAETLCRLGAIAFEVEATLIVDECYTDLSIGETPPGYLSLIESGAAAAGRFVVLHSLSKRSGVPGLRSGFLVGDTATVAAYSAYNRNCGVSTPLPVCAVASELWADDSHVYRLQKSLTRNWDLADEILGDLPQYRRAQAGLFLWLPVEDDEKLTRELWRRHAITVMPGRYLACRGPNGKNPGSGHVRIALVHGEAVMREALRRIREGLVSMMI